MAHRLVKRARSKLPSIPNQTWLNRPPSDRARARAQRAGAWWKAPTMPARLSAAHASAHAKARKLITCGSQQQQQQRRQGPIRQHDEWKAAHTAQSPGEIIAPAAGRLGPLSFLPQQKQGRAVAAAMQDLRAYPLLRWLNSVGKWEGKKTKFSSRYFSIQKFVSQISIVEREPHCTHRCRARRPSPMPVRAELRLRRARFFFRSGRAPPRPLYGALSMVMRWLHFRGCVRAVPMQCTAAICRSVTCVAMLLLPIVESGIGGKLIVRESSRALFFPAYRGCVITKDVCTGDTLGDVSSARARVWRMHLVLLWEKSRAVAFVR